MFRAAKQLLLLLEVLPGEPFDADGHEPVLAGVDNEGKKEYVTSVCVPMWTGWKEGEDVDEVTGLDVDVGGDGSVDNAGDEDLSFAKERIESTLSTLR